MYEAEAESDEDCAVYFLKPVNEYNIVDKIKEANKELFALDVETTDIGNANSNRKVSFALNLEDYEPAATDLQHKANAEMHSPTEADELILQLTRLKLKSERFAPIAEEEFPAAATLKVETSQTTATPQEEEICEEILDIVDMEAPATEAAPAQLTDKEDFSGMDEDDFYDSAAMLVQPSTATPSTQRRMERQNTFDYDGESDKKSLTNLLTESDCEEEERTLNEARLKLRQAYKSLYNTLDAKEQARIEALTNGKSPAATEQQKIEEDDDLSIIVASYIPDNFELNERSIYCKKDAAEDKDGKHKSSDKPTSDPNSTKAFFSGRRFSFRRKAKSTPSSAHNEPDIKLSYKTCCEYKNREQQLPLPRYTGYLSEYGLSAQQLQRRDQQLRRKQRFALSQTLNRSEQELQKMQDNERAFTTWLKNKMRYPINKTRNMFDAKLRRGSVAAATPPQPSSAGHRQHQQRRDSGDLHAYRHLLGHWDE